MSMWRGVVLRCAGGVGDMLRRVSLHASLHATATSVPQIGPDGVGCLVPQPGPREKQLAADSSGDVVAGSGVNRRTSLAARFFGTVRRGSTARGPSSAIHGVSASLGASAGPRGRGMWVSNSDGQEAVLGPCGGESARLSLLASLEGPARVTDASGPHAVVPDPSHKGDSGSVAGAAVRSSRVRAMVRRS